MTRRFPKLSKAQLKQAQRASYWRRKARQVKKAKPLAFEARKVLTAPSKPTGEPEALRPTLKQRKSFTSKVASIVLRLKPTPEELAEVRNIARRVAWKVSSNRQGRRA
jgi:hypothetical protein